LYNTLKFSNFKEKITAFSMKVTDSKDLLCKIIQNIRFRAPIFNQSLQESEHKKAYLLSHNAFQHRPVTSSERTSADASVGGKIFYRMFVCIFWPGGSLLLWRDHRSCTTETHNPKN